MKATVQTLERRWPLVAVLAALGLAAGLVWSLRAESGYRATAEVLVQRQSVTGIGGATLAPAEGRTIETDIALVTSPEVTKRTLLQASVTELTPDELADRISVRRRDDTDVLVISVLDTDPGRARMLADHAAIEFGKYRGELDTRALATAEARARTRLQELESQGRADAPAYERLEAELQTIATLRDLAETPVQVVRQAGEAVETGRDLWRDALLGLLLGAAVGVAAALVTEAVVQRRRSAAGVAARLGAPLLSLLPAPPRRVSRDEQLVTLAQPNGAGAEAVRLLRLNLEQAQARTGAGRTVLVTSAVDGEGKSTTAANLAVALARAGKHVALVDLDLRQPHIERFFHLPTTPGLTDVALARTALARSLHRIDLATGHRLDGRAEHGALHGAMPQGTLDVLVSGPLPAEPGEFAASDRVGNILAALGGHFDAVVVDAPPLLRVADAVALARRVDGVLLVVRLEKARRKRLEWLRWLLAQSPTPLLGVAVTSGDAPDAPSDRYEAHQGEGQGVGADASVATMVDRTRPLGDAQARTPPPQRAEPRPGATGEPHPSRARSVVGHHGRELGIAAAIAGTAGVLAWVLFSGQSRESTSTPSVSLSQAPPQATVSANPPSVVSPAAARVEAGSPLSLAWAPAAGATGYEVQLYVGADRVLSRRTAEPRLRLGRTWRYEGQTVTLEPGEYRWYVWPLGADGTRSGAAVVQSRLTVPATS